MSLEFKATAMWIHRRLMKMDWVSRHEQFYHLKAALTIGNVMQVVCSVFEMDDLLEGTLTGSSLPIPVIILGDRIRIRQLTIADFFATKKKRQRQLTLHDFFVKKTKRQRQLKIDVFFIKKAMQ
jgi:hypothetical protein